MLVRATDREILKYRARDIVVPLPGGPPTPRRRRRPAPARHWQRRMRRISRITGESIYVFGGRIGMLGGGIAGINPSSTTLLQLFKGAGSSAGRAGIYSGQFINIYTGGSNDPIDTIFNGTIPTPPAVPDWTVPGTTLCPAIIATFLGGPSNGMAPIPATYTGNSSFGNICNDILAIGAIPFVAICPNNPAATAASNWVAAPNCLTLSTFAQGDQGRDIADNPWAGGNNIYTSGTATYNNWIAQLAFMAGLMAQINGPFVIEPFGEANLSGSGTNWWCPGNGLCTDAQLEAMWIQAFEYWTYTCGLTNMLWSFGTNGGGDPSGYTNLAPPSEYFDLCGIHGSSTVDTSAHGVDMYNDCVATGKPVGWSSAGDYDGTIFTTNAQAIYENFPLGTFWIAWMQGAQIGASSASQANQSMSGVAAGFPTPFPYLNAANVPSNITIAGGVAG
jgi:hypothetical protein